MESSTSSTCNARASAPWPPRAASGERLAPDARAIAPGRIEILGNHVDYNGGPVLAAAVDRPRSR